MTSPIGNLAQLRDQLAKDLHVDIPVPRWKAPAPSFIVRYRPLTGTEADRFGSAVAAAKGSGAKSAVAKRETVRALVTCTLGIYADVNGEPHTIDPTDLENWLPLDPKAENVDYDKWLQYAELGKLLGVEEQSASAVCERLFLAEGDLAQHHYKLRDFSGFATEQIDENFSGE